FQRNGARQQKNRPPIQNRGAVGGAGGGGGKRAGGGKATPAISLYQAGKAALGGNFAPLGNIAESAGRGLLKTAAGIVGGPTAAMAQASIQNPRLAELQQQREQQLNQTPAGQYVQRQRAALAAEAARDTSSANKVARNVGRFLGAVAPVAATSAATGGSLPAVATTAALQSAAQPENMALNVGLSVAPIPVGQLVKSATRAVRRAFGTGAAQ